MSTGMTENSERRGTGKYEALLARCKDMPAVPTAVAHPCDDASLGAVTSEHYVGSHWLGTFALYGATQ